MSSNQTDPAKAAEIAAHNHAIGQRLRFARERRGITQADAVRGLAMHQSDLSRFELGTRIVPAWIAAALCDSYGINATWVLGVPTFQHPSSPNSEQALDREFDDWEYRVASAVCAAAIAPQPRNQKGKAKR